MLKNHPLILLILLISACAGPVSFKQGNIPDNIEIEQTTGPIHNECPGSVELSPELAVLFDVIQDEVLLTSVLGKPNAGKLCQGKVYKVKKDLSVTVYRAWNSTNVNSRFGKWWAFNRPAGKVAQYRYDYEICYQWSPLDKLIHCNLNSGAKVIIGTGQSAKCSPYLTYPASTARQIYIEQASTVVSDCKQYDAVFDWRPDSE